MKFRALPNTIKSPPCVVAVNDQRLIGGTGVRDSAFYLLERQRGFVSILVPEIVVHAEVCLPPQLVARLAVWDALDYSTLQRRGSSSWFH